jgi:YVTN family beta-propeller protein
MRMKTNISISLFLTTFLLTTLPALVAASATDYNVVQIWKLGGDGGWDYLTVDSDKHRMFIARATRVMVVDTASGKQIGEIPDTPGVHGVALDPSDGLGFTSNGREDMVSVFNLNSLAVTRKIKVGSGPDAILYDPFSKRVFTLHPQI